MLTYSYDILHHLSSFWVLSISEISDDYLSTRSSQRYFALRSRLLLRQADISRFSRTSQRLHAVVGSYLFSYSVHHNRAYALASGAYKGYRAVVEKCLAANPPEIDASPSDDWRLQWQYMNPLYLAIKGQNTDIVELLLHHGVIAANEMGGPMTPLMVAAQFGNVASIKMLIEYGARVYGRDHQGCAHVYYAALTGGVERLQVLLEQKIDVNIAGDKHRTPLHPIAGRGHSPSLKRLLDHVADVAAPDGRGHSPLVVAARGGHLACIQLMLEYGAEDQLSSNIGRIALFEALRYGRHRLAEFFLKRGAILERKEELLISTAANGHLASVDIIVRHGVHIDCKDGTHKTLLFHAVQS